MNKITWFQFGLWAVLTTLFVQPCAAQNRITLNFGGGENTSLTITESVEYSDKGWGELRGVPDPMRPGWKFMGWKCTNTGEAYPLNLILKCQTPLEMVQNQAGSTSGVTATAKHVGHWFSGNPDGEWVALKQDYKYTDKITVNVWACVTDKEKKHAAWSTAVDGKMRILSCTAAGGWNIGGEYWTDGLIRFAIRDAYEPNTAGTGNTNDGTGVWRYTTFTKKWTELSAGWHMFTLVFDGETAYGYIDGGNKVGGSTASSVNFTLRDNKGAIRYKPENHIIVGAEASGGPNADDGKYVQSGSRFKGHIRNLSILHEALTAEEIAQLYTLQGAADGYVVGSTDAAAYSNHLRTDAKTSNDVKNYVYQCTAMWEALSPSTVVCTQTDEKVRVVDKKEYVALVGEAFENTIISSPLANGDYTVENGIYKDHDKFHYWTGTGETETSGVDYLSNFQRHEGAKLTGTGTVTVGNTEVLFGGDVIDGETSELTVGQNEKEEYICYRVSNPKWEDCFTVNIWATAADWDATALQGHTARILSCTNRGGFDIYVQNYKVHWDMWDEERQKNYSCISKLTIDKDFTGYHMFTYVYNGTGKYIMGYVDGKLEAVSDQLIDPWVYPTNLEYIFLGAEPDAENKVGANSHFIGTLKNFAMIHAALSPSQVKELYEAQKAKSPHLFYYHPAPVKDDAGAETPRTLQSVWTTLPLLAATNNGSKIVGENEFKHDLQIQGNGKEATTLTPANGIEVTSNINETTGNGTADFTYTPAAGNSTALTLSASRSTDQQAVAWVNFQPEETTAAVSESTTLTEQDIEDNSYVLVQRDLTLTGKHTLQDVYLNAYNQLSLGNNTENPITANSVTIRTKGDDEKTALVMPANSSLKVNKVTLTKQINNSQYYFFSLPFDCKIADVTVVGKNLTEAYGIYYEFYHYDGMDRVYNQGYVSSWKVVPYGGTLQAHKGYAVAIGSFEETGTAKVEVEMVFPMSVSTGASGTAGEAETVDLATYDNEDKEVDVVAWGLEEEANNNGNKCVDVHPSNYGWNLVGNPYFASYGMAALDNDNNGGILKTGHKNGKLVAEGCWVEDGNYYEDDGKSVYITYSEDGGVTYKQALFGNKFVLNPFSAYFVQVANTGKLTYKLDGKNPSQQQQSIRSRMPAAVSTTKYINLNLSGKAQTDETTLVIGEKFTTQYEVGADLQKWLAEDASALQVYLSDASCMYRFMALNKETVQKTDIPVGICLPAAGEYTFSLPEADKEKVEAVYLTDKETGQRVDLKDTDYPFTVSSATKSDKRFVISAVVNADVATVLSDTKADPTKARKVWENGTLYIIRNGEVYTTDGRKVR